MAQISLSLEQLFQIKDSYTKVKLSFVQKHGCSDKLYKIITLKEVWVASDTTDLI